MSADALLEALDPDQREVALALAGPVCVPAPASTQTGPARARATSRWSGSRASRRASADITPSLSVRADTGRRRSLAAVDRAAATAGTAEDASSHDSELRDNARTRDRDHVHHHVVRLLPTSQGSAGRRRDPLHRGGRRAPRRRRRVRRTGQFREPHGPDGGLPGRVGDHEPVREDHRRDRAVPGIDPFDVLGGVVVVLDVHLGERDACVVQLTLEASAVAAPRGGEHCHGPGCGRCHGARSHGMSHPTRHQLWPPLGPQPQGTDGGRCRRGLTDSGVMSADALLEALDPDQREVALALAGPVCVLAGAGTGKTRAITHRIAYGVRTGAYPPNSVLAVTFTARAAGEMRTRLRDLGVSGVQARTFHAAALRQLSFFWPKVVGGAPPTTLGQKKLSWRSAAAWNVRACTPETPRSRRRVRISPAARAVNVTARTLFGG